VMQLAMQQYIYISNKLIWKDTQNAKSQR
jgi:hypothetical protein